MTGEFPVEGVELTQLLVVSDLERARDFYRDVLCARLYREYGGTSAVLEFQGNWLLLVTGGGPTPDKPGVTFAPPPDPDTVSHQLTLRVPDCHAAYEVLNSRGAQFLTPPLDRGGEIRCFFRDPDGHLLEISEVTQAGRARGAQRHHDKAEPRMSSDDEVCSSPGHERPNFFVGQLLSAEDLQAEQEYFLEKQRQHNRAMLGYGVVKGLEIAREAQRVSVAPGLAVDAAGNLIELTDPCEFDLPEAGSWDLIIELVEILRDPVPVVTTEGETEGATEFSRIQEVVRVRLERSAQRVDAARDTASEAEGRAGVHLGKIRVGRGD